MARITTVSALRALYAKWRELGGDERRDRPEQECRRSEEQARRCETPPAQGRRGFLEREAFGQEETRARSRERGQPSRRDAGRDESDPQRATWIRARAGTCAEEVAQRQRREDDADDKPAPRARARRAPAAEAV